MTKRRKRQDRNQSRVVVYLRVSTQEQAEEGISLEAQEIAARGYCAMRGLEIAHVVTDPGVSASKALSKRPGGRRLLDIIADSDVGGVVAMKLDRLFRSVLDCLTVVDDWRGDDVALHLLDMGGAAMDTSSAMGSMFLTIVAAFAEMERRLISERTVSALAAKRAKGEQTGRVPYGWGVDEEGVLVASEYEQGVLSDVLAMRAAGASLRAITEDLNGSGTPPPPAHNGGRQGTRWHLTTVARLLKRPGPTANTA